MQNCNVTPECTKTCTKQTKITQSTLNHEMGRSWSATAGLTNARLHEANFMQSAAPRRVDGQAQRLALRPLWGYGSSISPTAFAKNVPFIPSVARQRGRNRKASWLSSAQFMCLRWHFRAQSDSRIWCPVKTRVPDNDRTSMSSSSNPSTETQGTKTKSSGPTQRLVEGAPCLREGSERILDNLTAKSWFSD